MRLGVALDFDGVLYDTYPPAAAVLRAYEERLGLPHGLLLRLEDAAEALGAWDRRPLYRTLGLPEELHEEIWAARVSAVGSLSLPMRLRGMGLRVYLVCGSDATPSEKLKRVELTGARLVFDDIVVYEPGRLHEALEGLVRRESLHLLVYVDDKPGNTCMASRVERVRPIHVAYRPPLPDAWAWRGHPCAPTTTHDKLEEAILEALTSAEAGNPSL